MRNKTIIVLLILGLVAAGGLGLYAYAGWQEALRGRAGAEARIFTLSNRADSLAAWLRLDSLIYAGDFAAAREVLGADAGNLADSLSAAGRARFAHLEDVRQLRIIVDTLRRRAPLRDTVLLAPPPEEPALAPAPPPNQNDDRLDSLRQELYAANRRIIALENRRPEPVKPEFLRFRTGEGNEVYYVGELRNGKAHGQGVAILSTGSRYRGEWRSNQKHGEGIFTWSDEAYYEGQYENDQRSGRGTYHFPDGSRYEGEWRGDLRHGRGKYFNKKGKLAAEGRWEADEFVGKRE